MDTDTVDKPEGSSSAEAAVNPETAAAGADFQQMSEEANPQASQALNRPSGFDGVERRIAVRVDDGERDYPSLYDGQYTTIVAVLLGLLIVGGIQALAWQIYRNAKTDYRALTQFVTMMVGLVLGAYMADLLIAGPSTSLLSDDEHTVILGFVKDICLMVFSYYFGTRSNGGKPELEE